MHCILYCRVPCMPCMPCTLYALYVMYLVYLVFHVPYISCIPCTLYTLYSMYLVSTVSFYLVAFPLEGNFGARLPARLHVYRQHLARGRCTRERRKGAREKGYLLLLLGSTVPRDNSAGDLHPLGDSLTDVIQTGGKVD